MYERAFLDANVLFAAALASDGVARMLIRVSGLRGCTLLTSAFARDEARRNLHVKYPEHLASLERRLGGVEIVAEADPTRVAYAGRWLPEKDAPILAAALAAHAEVLVTGDRRHFGALFGGRVGGVLVLPPRAMLERLVDV